MNVDFFVQNVKSRCRIMGVSPSKACMESGAGRSFLDNVKRGRVPSVDGVQLLANYLGVTVSELLGERAPSVPEQSEELDLSGFQIVTAYYKADPGTQAAVRKLLDVKNDET